MGGQYDWEEARLSTLLMVSERWLQLAEMGLELSRLLCRGEMEKSCWGWEGTALGLLRILITWRGKGERRMLEIWKIEDQSIDRVEGKYFFSANIEPSWHFTVKMPIEIHHFNFEIGKGKNFPIFFFFFKEYGEGYMEGDEVRKKEKGNKRDCFH